MRVRFLANYNHRWPSGAATSFKAGWEGTVNTEAGTAAITKGLAKKLPPESKDEKANRVGGSDPRPDAKPPRKPIRKRASRARAPKVSG